MPAVSFGVFDTDVIDADKFFLQHFLCEGDVAEGDVGVIELISFYLTVNNIIHEFVQRLFCLIFKAT